MDNQEKILRFLLERKLITKEKVDSLLKDEDESKTATVNDLIKNDLINEELDREVLPPDVLNKIKDNNITLYGRYIRLNLLGKGGGGAVYKAYDTKLKRFVALKILDITDEENAGRFRREAEILATLEHPNIVPIHDIGSRKDEYYIAMKYIEGDTLQDASSQLTQEQILGITAKVCSAIEFANRKGIIHRDIKPRNIIVSKDYSVYVVDFGTAKLADSIMTGKGDIIGTPNYMSPEQIQGQHVDERTDVYSLGLTLYYALTGQDAIMGDTLAESLKNSLETTPIRPSKIDKRINRNLDKVIMKSIEKDSSLRYQTAHELEEEIERVVNNEPVRAGSTPLTHRMSLILKKKKVQIISTLLAIVVVTVIYRNASENPLEARQKATPFFESARELFTGIKTSPDYSTRQEMNNALNRSLESVNSALESDPTFEEALILKADILHASGLREDAINELSRAININPNSSEARYKRIYYTFIPGSPYNIETHPTSIPLTEPLIANSDSDIRKLRHLGTTEIKIALAETIIFYGNMKLRLALSTLEPALDKNPNFTDAVIMRGRIKREIYNDAKLAGLEPIESATTDFRKALKLNPNAIRCYFYLAELLQFQGKYDRALKHIEKLKVYDPLDPTILCREAAILEFMGDREEALSTIQQTHGMEQNLQNNSYRTYFYIFRAKLYLRFGMKDKGLSDLDSAILIVPEEYKEGVTTQIEVIREKNKLY